MSVHPRHCNEQGGWQSNGLPSGRTLSDRHREFQSLDANGAPYRYVGRRQVLLLLMGGTTILAGCAKARSVPRELVPVASVPRSGAPDEVRLGLFGAPDGSSVPPNPLTEAIPRLSGTPAVERLRLRAVTIRANRFCAGGCPAAIDLDSRLFTNEPQKVPAWFLSVALSSTATPEAIPDLVLFDRLDALRYAATHQLVLPLDRMLPAGVSPVADAWPGAMEVTRAYGRTWAVPLAVQPLVLTYQPVAFRACVANCAFPRPSVPIPTNDWTWDDLLRVAKRLTPPAPPQANPVLGSGPDQTSGSFGFFATSPDSLPVFVWQAGGEVIAGQGKGARCVLETAAALDGQRFIFDLIHRDQVSPRQTPDGAWNGSAAMQLGPAIGGNFVLPPRNKVAATGYSLDIGLCLAVTARARDPERAVQAALALIAAVQGPYDWPVSRSAAETRAKEGGSAATAVAALRMVRPPGLIADVRDAVETVALSLANEIVPPAAATLNDQQLVKEEAKTACSAINKALQALL